MLSPLSHEPPELRTPAPKIKSTTKNCYQIGDSFGKCFFPRYFLEGVNKACGCVQLPREEDEEVLQALELRCPWRAQAGASLS